MNFFSLSTLQPEATSRQVAEQAVEHEEQFGDVLVHHISNFNEYDLLGWTFHLPEIELFGVDLSITKHVLMLWLAALLVLFVFRFGLKWNNLAPRGVLTGLFEPIVAFVRDEIVYINFGKKGKPFVPYFLSLFFFILFMNLLGLIPLFSTATSNITVTATLAAVTFSLIHVVGMIKHGPVRHFLNFVPPGVPLWITPILFPLEIIGTAGKSVALAIRLFASMTAGHIVILAFLGLIIVLQSYFVSIFSIPFALFIYILEIFFAFLQAFIFTFLSSMFISMTFHGEH